MTSVRYTNNVGLFDDNPFHASNIYRQSSMDRKSSVFGSIKSKFSTKKSTTSDLPSPSPSSVSMNSGSRSNTHNPFATSAPRTRRPRDAGFANDSNEPPPPAYTPNPTNGDTISEPPVPRHRSSGTTSNTVYPSSDGSSSTAPITASTKDDKYAFLSSFDTVFLIDDSGSMAGRSWRECSEALSMITPICVQHDADGIDMYFLNTKDSPQFHNITLTQTVKEIFSSVKPSGHTPTGQVLNRILKKYLAEFKANKATTKPLNIIVITDGVPSDDLDSVIINAAKALDAAGAEPWQVGIQMFQTGEEPGAQEYLEELDNELSTLGGGCRDIVDTVPYDPERSGGLTGDFILKVVLGAVVKRLDRKRNSQLNVSRR